MVALLISCQLICNIFLYCPRVLPLGINVISLTPEFAVSVGSGAAVLQAVISIAVISTKHNASRVIICPRAPSVRCPFIYYTTSRLKDVLEILTELGIVLYLHVIHTSETNVTVSAAIAEVITNIKYLVLFVAVLSGILHNSVVLVVLLA